ncbi:hypothetical protein EF384_06525 [Aerococcus agrisoli]|uniref:Rho termination factor N-terminal domain-containing protein n=1 Tax=Aerococcus agrisoli TaxID=2487350 RepID=A0A3N4GLW0_9LACT|nr:hypothetical protein [Aerococcus agrisoli]RPA59580.1 hypothetical protein EF384_06525 [Aerococcus agrisoli]
MTDLKTIERLYQEYPETPYINPNRDVDTFMAKLDVQKEHLVPKRNMERNEDGLLPGHIILLWRLDLGTFTTDSAIPRYFEYIYGIDAETDLARLIDEGYAYQMSAKEALYLVNAGTLKKILKNAGLSGYSSMKKDELIKFVASKISEEDLAPQMPLIAYTTTEKGHDLVVKYDDVIQKHGPKG